MTHAPWDLRLLRRGSWEDYLACTINIFTEKRRLLNAAGGVSRAIRTLHDVKFHFLFTMLPHDVKTKRVVSISSQYVACSPEMYAVTGFAAACGMLLTWRK